MRINEVAEQVADFPSRLRETRNALGQSLRDVSDATGLAVSTVHRVEHGKNATVDSLVTLMEWVGEREDK